MSFALPRPIYAEAKLGGSTQSRGKASCTTEIQAMNYLAGHFGLIRMGFHISHSLPHFNIMAPCPKMSSRVRLRQQVMKVSPHKDGMSAVGPSTVTWLAGMQVLEQSLA